MTIPRRFKRPEPGREFPRDVMLKLPAPEDCCTPEETAFWKQTLQLAQGGARPRVVAEFAAHGLDDPNLVRAYPVIREAMVKWATMGDSWLDYGIRTPDSQEAPVAWYQS